MTDVFRSRIPACEQLARLSRFMTDTCGDVCCRGKRRTPDDAMLTEINPPGGYGRPQLLVCDEGMRSGRWDHWIAEHWPNWPDLPRAEVAGGVTIAAPEPS